MKKYLYTIFAAVLMTSLTGCFDDPGTDVLLETNEVSIADASETGKSERRIVVVPDGQSSAEIVNIGLIGPALNQDVTVTVGVDAAGSSAIEGVDFTIPNKTVTIPSGSFSAPVTINVNDDVLDPETPLTLVLEITDASIDVNENYQSFAITLVGICPPDLFDYSTLEGTYTVTSSGESTDGCPANNPLNNFVYDGVELTIDSETDSEITFVMSEAFGGMYIEWYGDCYGYTFETPELMIVNKETGDITINASSAFAPDIFTILGAVDPCNGNFTTSWTNVYGDTGANSYVKQ